MARKSKDFEDDGRVIAPMNVEGMPWYDSHRTKNKDADAEKNAQELKKIGKKETFHLILGVLGAALAVTAVFALGYLLFILFCQYVWFRV